MIDSGPKAPENRIHLFDPVGLINEKYANYGVRPRHAATNATAGGLRLTVEPKAADSDSGSSSPRLWNPNGNTSPPTSPRFTTSPPPHQLQNHSHQQHHQNPESMSPNSRTQAIARGRRELMDMIKDMPESYYELSLRDIVDRKSSLPPAPPSFAAVEVKPPQKDKKVEVVAKKLPQEEAPKDKKKKKEGKKKKEVGKSESKKKMMMKNRSVDNGGFLLKTTVFPIPFRSKKKKRSLSAVPSFKVAPKTNPKGADKHWWVRKARVSNDAGDSTSTSRSSSIVSRHKQNTRFLPSCCSFFSEKKMKSKK